MASNLALAGVGLAAALLGAGAVAVSGSPIVGGDRAAVEAIVHDYILDHPEILPQAMERLQARETGKLVRANRDAIVTPYEGAWEGSANPDVVLVEFFDYACGYCRASLPDIDRLLKADPKLRIVYRELPVLGPDSEVAAQISLIAARSGRYPQFHRALYAAGRPDRATVERVARQFGIDPAQRNPAASREIESNLQLQRALNITGTPSWVVGDKLLAGAVGFDAIRAAIAEVRAGR